MRAAGAIAVSVALALIGPAAARGAPVLDAGDAAELAQSLADATEAQGVCYGWRVSVDDGSGGPSGDDVGSNRGPGVPVATTGACRRSVELVGSITYTCGSCEAEDSSSITVRSSFDGAASEAGLERLGLEGGDLRNDDGDEVLASMIGALPLLTASSGAAPSVPGAVRTQPIPAADGPQNSPSTPDWLRESWLALTCLAVLIVAAAGGLVWDLVRRSRRRTPPAATEPTPDH